MLIKDVIKNVALLLNREHVIKYLEDESEKEEGDAKEQTELFISCINLVINELACSFSPMKTTEKLTSNGKILVNEFSEKPLKFIRVTNERGEIISYNINAEGITTKAGTVYVTYEYLPPQYELNDKIGFSDNRITARILAYGAVAEVCLIERLFNESVSFRKRYTEEISKLILPRSINQKARRWA